MRRPTTLLLILGVLLAACSFRPFVGGDPDPSLDPDVPVGTAPGSPGPDPDGDGALRETPDASIVDAHPTAVDHFAIGPDGRTVIVYYWGGTQACFGLQKVQITADADGTPVVTVYEGTHPEAVGQACTMEALLKSTLVTLDAAVLVDASQPDAPVGEPELAVQPEIVVVQPDVLDPIPVAITGYHLSADGLTLTAHFYGGVPECYGLAEASVQAGSRPLTVTIREGRVPGAEVCIEIALAKGVVFDLEAPLIRDGSVEPT